MPRRVVNLFPDRVRMLGDGERINFSNGDEIRGKSYLRMPMSRGRGTDCLVLASDSGKSRLTRLRNFSTSSMESSLISSFLEREKIPPSREKSFHLCRRLNARGADPGSGTVELYYTVSQLLRILVPGKC